MWHRLANLRDSPSPRRPALFSSASVNAKARCGIDEMIHIEVVNAGRRERSAKFADKRGRDK